MEFTISRKKFKLSLQDVLKKMPGVEPEVIRTYAVKIKGKAYPAKQVLSIVTDLSRADFTSHQAHQILRRLGLEVAASNPGAKK